jgi:mitogen-activated protein kinase 15
MDAPKEDGSKTQVLTDYVATRWYRAPEILLGSNNYSKAVDMWSIGCILGELIGSKPMFPGSSTINQIDRIMTILGRPTAEDLEAIQSDFAGQMLDNIPVHAHGNGLEDMYAAADPEAMDLLKKLLSFNPAKRLTVEQALDHPYVGQFHNPAEEIKCEKKIVIPINDNKKMSVATYRDELYTSIIKVNVETKKEKVVKKVRAAREKKATAGNRGGTKKKTSSTKKATNTSSGSSGPKKTKKSAPATTDKSDHSKTDKADHTKSDKADHTKAADKADHTKADHTKADKEHTKSDKEPTKSDKADHTKADHSKMDKEHAKADHGKEHTKADHSKAEKAVHTKKAKEKE